MNKLIRITNGNSLSRWTRLRTGSLAGLLLCSSCAAPFQMAAPEPFAGDDPPATVAIADGALPATTRSPIQQTAHEIASRAQSQSVTAPQREWPALPEGAYPVGFASEPQTSKSRVMQTQYYPPDPRIALPHCPPPNACPPMAPQLNARPISSIDLYPDEYICDGGDRDLPVTYPPTGREGLDPEDTVGVFVGEDGELHVRPSTRTCVYAPRFAAVRTASSPYQGVTIDRAAGSHDAFPSRQLDFDLSAQVELKANEAVAMRLRERASGLDRDATTDLLGQVVRLEDHIKILNVYEDRAFLGEGQLDKLTKAVLQAHVTAALEWNRVQNPVILAKDVERKELITRYSPQEYLVVEDRSTPGDLRILKTADKGAAEPGDIITFTIRYANVGDRELTDVVLLDNLTPRLEYVEGSADSERDGRLVVEDNEEGSVILRFEFAEPLPGKTSSHVTFQARVR